MIWVVEYKPDDEWKFRIAFETRNEARAEARVARAYFGFKTRIRKYIRAE